ncbi:hypothetical protein R1flu_002218 [Riccia fluitans]|uniref:Iron permease FTR1 n=1 Tax=Riccia fluitans TaxID=41844 RepID=A0ABD1Y5H0_9MARC
MIRIDTWRTKWERKLTKVTTDSVQKHTTGELQSTKSKYTLFLIPFTVVVREGVEAMIFLGGIGLEGSGTAYPLAAVKGAVCGILIGYLLYRGGNHVAFKWFLGASTLLLLNDDGIWKLLNAVVGWRDEATVGTLTSYFIYWGFVIVSLLVLHLKWKQDAERDTRVDAEEASRVAPADLEVHLDGNGV